MMLKYLYFICIKQLITAKEIRKYAQMNNRFSCPSDSPNEQIPWPCLHCEENWINTTGSLLVMKIQKAVFIFLMQGYASHL